MTDTQLAELQKRATEVLKKLPKSDAYTGDRMYILGRINAIIEIRRLLNGS